MIHVQALAVGMLAVGALLCIVDLFLLYPGVGLIIAALLAAYAIGRAMLTFWRS